MLARKTSFAKTDHATSTFVVPCQEIRARISAVLRPDQSAFSKSGFQVRYGYVRLYYEVAMGAIHKCRLPYKMPVRTLLGGDVFRNAAFVCDKMCVSTLTLRW